MKKLILIAAVALIVQPCLGQKLISKIPDNAQYVLTVNTPNILSKMSMAEMEGLPVVKQMVKEFVKGRKYYKSYNSADERLGLKDLGFDFNKKSYAFMEPTDSVMYFCYLVPLNSVSKFVALNDSSMHQIYNKKGLKIIAGRTDMVAWNKKTALFITGTKQKSYFKDHPDIYSRYGMGADTTKKYNYYSKYKEQKEIVKIWMKDKVIDIFAKKKKTPPHRFLEYTDNDAAMSIWSSSKDFYSHYLGIYSGIKMPTISKASYFPGGDMIYHAYINESDITLKSAIKLDDAGVKSYEKIFNNQLNPKFFDYIDNDKFLSYYSNAFSVTGVLEEVPNFINTYLGASLDKYGVKESIELVSVILDEEAIGKVVVGDAIMVLTDLSSREKTYTAYEWDENYTERTEVTKTKEETIPGFLYMMSTKDERSVENIIKLSMKANKKLVKKEGYYELDLYRNAPFKMYFVVRDGIVFMCNSEQQLQDILTNKKVNRIPPNVIASISSASFQAFVDGKRIMDEIPEPQGSSKRSEKDKKMWKHAKESVGSLSVKQNLSAETGLTSEFVYSFTSKEKNSLTYFFHFINEIYMIDKPFK